MFTRVQRFTVALEGISYPVLIANLKGYTTGIGEHFTAYKRKGESIGVFGIILAIFV